MRLPRMTTRQWMVAVAVVALLLGWVVWSRRPLGVPLDPVAWRDPVRVRQGVRLEMADRIVGWGTLRGKTRQQVVELLGEPSDEGYFREWDHVEDAHQWKTAEGAQTALKRLTEKEVIESRDKAVVVRYTAT